MDVHFCDLCSQPMKDGMSYILYVASPQTMSETLETKEDITHYIDKVGREQKEICPTCKKLFDRIFFHRLEGMAALTEECYDLFNLPPYEPKKKKGKK